MVGESAIFGALGRAASGIDITLVRLALAVSLGKRKRLRELDTWRRYYEEMAERYAAIDPRDFYARPDPVREMTEHTVTRLPHGEVVDLAWSSGYVPHLSSARDSYLRHRVNATARTRLFRHDRPGAPAFIWIHGYRGGQFPIEQRIARARELYDCGFDVALFTMPFHGARAPLEALRAPIFPSQTHVPHTNEGFGQLVWDLRSLLEWLRASGAPSAGIVGLSLGGYAASLMATLESDLSFVVPYLPMADFTEAAVAHEALRGVAIDEGVKEASRRALAIHRPLERAPQLPSDRILVMGGEADRITGRPHAELLARHFGASLDWSRGGHIFQYDRDAAFRTIRAFVRSRAARGVA
jgi:pimeloyl-ACP methyl ester carboxylesterase